MINSCLNASKKRNAILCFEIAIGLVSKQIRYFWDLSNVEVIERITWVLPTMLFLYTVGALMMHPSRFP